MTTDVYQNCQANQDCNFSIVGQICQENKCIFSCGLDSDCIANGKCLATFTCDWSGEPVPPLFNTTTTTTNTIKNLDNNNTTNNNNNSNNNNNNLMKLNSPIVIAAIIVTVLAILCGLIAILFCVFNRKNRAKQSRDLKPFRLSGGSRTSFKKSRRTSREKESRSSKQHDDLFVDDPEVKEEFEETYSPDAVGSTSGSTGGGAHRVPVRSQTMYGTSTPSTVELNVGYPELTQHTHFMQDNNNQPELTQLTQHSLFMQDNNNQPPYQHDDNQQQ